jgi:acetylornithine/succinyldiaminopimelate/putrescine aminotransferase
MSDPYANLSSAQCETQYVSIQIEYGIYPWKKQLCVGQHRKKHLDLVVGITMCGTNHCNPAVTVAVCKQEQTLIHHSNLYYVLEQAKLAAKMLEISSLGKIFFSNLGAEAINMEMKKQLVLCLSRFWQKYSFRESATSVMAQVF